MHPLSAVPHVLCGALPRWGLCGCCIHALGKHTSEHSISELTHSLGRRRETKSPAWKNLAGGPAVPLEGDCRPSPDGVLEEGDGVETLRLGTAHGKIGLILLRWGLSLLGKHCSAISGTHRRLLLGTY